MTPGELVELSLFSGVLGVTVPPRELVEIHALLGSSWSDSPSPGVLGVIVPPRDLVE